MTPSDPRLESLQPDLFSRYEALRQIFAEAGLASTEGPVTVIDIGSGPSRLTELALGPDFKVIRADTLVLDDPDSVLLEPGADLPFDTDAATVVLAMDVLEHIPGELRDEFLSECARVARDLVVIACPVASETTVIAEKAFDQVTEGMSGQPNGFLHEHADLGLPDEADVVRSLEQAAGPIASLPNAAIDLWLAENLIDYVVNFRLGPHGLREELNTEMNRRTPIFTQTTNAYRRLFVGSPSRSIDTLQVAEKLLRGGDDPSATEIVAMATERLVREVASLRAALQDDAPTASPARSITAPDIDALDLQVAALHHANERLRRHNVTLAAEIAATAGGLSESNDAASDDATTQESPDPANAPSPTPANAGPPDDWRAEARNLAGRALRRGKSTAVAKARSALSTSSNEPASQPAEASAPAIPEPSAESTAETSDVPDRFDEEWYISIADELGESGLDPWVHYLEVGQHTGLIGHRLFDPTWYSERYPDVVDNGIDPFLDWAIHHRHDGREPNEFFDSANYLSRYPDVAEAGFDAIAHYRDHGWSESRTPGPLFDPAWYRAQYPDVDDSGMDPLLHFVRHGRSEGRHPNHLALVSAEGRYRPPDGLIPWFSPVTFAVEPDLESTPRLNVLLPGMGVRHLTGGPNTAIQLGYRLAAEGVDVRFIATDAALDDDTGPLWDHMASISGIGRRLPNVEVVDGSNRLKSVWIGPRDLFLATAWWTAQSVKAAMPLVQSKRFLYLIQDFEPLFFASSSQYALAVETYGLDHIPIVNTQFLLDHLVDEGVGLYADPDFAAQALVFEPTVDRAMFRPAIVTEPKKRKRLLFYARPTGGLRNLFELGAAAIQLAIHKGIFDEDEWEFFGMGEQFEPIAIGPSSVLRPLPWQNLDGYAMQMAQSDILLSPMLAPHPSYPPLEMAACGGVVVTTEFGPKTKRALARISPNIIGTPATIEALAAGLAEAVSYSSDFASRLRGADLSLPADWNAVFAPLVPRVRERLGDLDDPSSVDDGLKQQRLPGHYESWLSQRIESRSSEYPEPALPNGFVFSLITAAWNTPGNYLEALAESVFQQDVMADCWEWVITDNGSTNPETLRILDRLATDPRVQLVRQPTNLGILGGMRSCLDAATGRYIVHVDHDDVLTADALRIVACHLAEADWPAAFYTDEDKLDENTRLDPFLKPGWDPVLFANSCYIAHLCGVDRELAQQLDAYSDSATEASPDWDLFTRFSSAGHTPLHIDEVVYAWRVHHASTANNPTAKPYAMETHRRVLERLIASKPEREHFTVEIHPDSPDKLDWWIRRQPVDPRPLITAVHGGPAPASIDGLSADIPHQVISVDLGDPEGVLDVIREAREQGALLHFLASGVKLVRDAWYWEAVGVFELYPDSAIIGGPVVKDGSLESTGQVFGFGPNGWGSPGAGAPSNSRGWFGHNLKQRSVDGVLPYHLVIEPARLPSLTVEAGQDFTDETFGVWLSLAAAHNSSRVIYSPLLRVNRSRAARLVSPTAGTWQVACADASSNMTRSRWLSLDARRPFEPTTKVGRFAHLEKLRSTRTNPSVVYSDWLNDRLRDRLALRSRLDGGSTIDIITPIYDGSDPELLLELAGAIERQTHPHGRWVLGLDGPIGPALQAVLDRFEADDQLRVHLRPGPKRGIIKTMEACLGAVAADYYVPIDADDLIVDDALECFARAVSEAQHTVDLLFSDEDVIDAAGPRDPFLRPGWDPVLHLASSYVWHALCIRSATARSVGVYGDPLFDWCHDWDTVERIRASGGRIDHVPEVLYHWRRHEGSSTNTDAPESAQTTSVTSMFQRFASTSGSPYRYTVAEFPMWRGATEFHLQRKTTEPPTATLITLGPLERVAREALERASTFPFEAVVEGPGSGRSVMHLAELIEGLDTDRVVLLEGASLVAPGEPIWEATKWFELAPDTAVVAGRSIGLDGRLATGAEVDDPSVPSGLFHPLDGLDPSDPGPYALALKPHTVDVVDMGLAMVHRDRFLAALVSVDQHQAISAAGVSVGRALRNAGFRSVFTPLITVMRSGGRPASNSELATKSTPRGLARLDFATHTFR